MIARRLQPMTSALLWGAAFTLIPVCLQSFSPSNLVAARFGLAAAVFALLLWTGVIEARPIHAKDWFRFSVVMTSMILIYNLALCIALRELPAGLAILVAQAAPVLILMIDRVSSGRFQVERPCLSLVTWCVGTTIVFVHYRPALGNGSWLSILALSITPIALAAYNTLSRPLLTQYGAGNVCAQMFLIGGATLFLIQCFRNDFWLQLTMANFTSLAALGGLVLFTTVISYTIWFSQIAEQGPAEMAVYLNLVPVFGLLLAVVFLREPLTPWLTAGGLFVILGSIGCAYRRRDVHDE